jgi:hypothetical protein
VQVLAGGEPRHFLLLFIWKINGLFRRRSNKEPNLFGKLTEISNKRGPKGHIYILVAVHILPRAEVKRNCDFCPACSGRFHNELAGRFLDEVEQKEELDELAGRFHNRKKNYDFTTIMKWNRKTGGRGRKKRLTDCGILHDELRLGGRGGSVPRRWSAASSENIAAPRQGPSS